LNETSACEVNSCARYEFTVHAPLIPSHEGMSWDGAIALSTLKSWFGGGGKPSLFLFALNSRERFFNMEVDIAQLAKCIRTRKVPTLKTCQSQQGLLEGYIGSGPG
jgi:hypothetical protein